MADATMSAIQQMANREVFNNTFRNASDGSIFDYIDYANTGDVDYKTTTVYATGGQGGGRKVGFTGSPQATMKFTTQLVTPKLISMLAGSEIITGKNVFRHKVITSVTAETTTTITFPTTETPATGTLSVYPKGVELIDANKVLGTLADGVYTFTTKATADGDYECFYQTSITGSQTVTFKSDKFPKDFIWDGETVWKGEDGTTRTEVFHAYKVTPQQNFTMSYSNTGDPGKFEIVFDLFADADNNIFDKTFLPEE